MTTWWMDLKVIWVLLGLAAAAGIMSWRVNHSEKLLLSLDKRTSDLELWKAKAEEKLRHLEED